MGEEPLRRWAGRAAWLLALAACAAIVVGGVLATVLRPTAPAIGALPAASTWFDEALLERIAAYRGPLYVIGPAAALLSALGPLILVTRPSVQRMLQGRFAGRRGGSGVGVVARAATVAVLVVALQDALLLPVRWWTGFHHAGVFGLRTQGLAGWTGDRIIADATGWFATALTVAVVAWWVTRHPRRWPVGVGLSLATLSAVAVIVWPLVVEPLRFDLVPLGPGSTRDAVVQVRDAAGLEEVPILVADASRRTTRRNAYVSGWGATQRIVLYDTLLEIPDEEIAAVVAHEVAHALHADLVRGWAGGAAAVVTLSLGMGWWLRRSRAATASVDLGRLVADPGVVATIVAVALALEVLLAPAGAWVSRRAEASADATALELTAAPEAFAQLQRSLVDANLSDPNPPAWWRWWRATHPAPAERIHRAERAAEDGGEVQRPADQAGPPAGAPVG